MCLDEANTLFWLATWAGEMGLNLVPRSEWDLGTRLDGPIFNMVRKNRHNNKEDDLGQDCTLELAKPWI